MQALTPIQNDLKSTTITIKTTAETDPTTSTALQHTAYLATDAFLSVKDHDRIDGNNTNIYNTCSIGKKTGLLESLKLMRQDTVHAFHQLIAKFKTLE